MADNLNGGSVHEQAVSLIERLVSKSIGDELLVSVTCNECRDVRHVDLVANGHSVLRNRTVGTVRPDLAVLDANNKPLRFLEVIDSHKPGLNVHEYALAHGIEVFEFHLRSMDGSNLLPFSRRRTVNKALDEALVIKKRLDDLRAGRIVVDAHTLLCDRPKCLDCGTRLPRRTITISKYGCWNCKKVLLIATGSKDGHSIQGDELTNDEVSFARSNGVFLERRFSATMRTKYLANICNHCDQIMGEWYLHVDPYHEDFRLPVATLVEDGPCDACAQRYCHSHGEWFTYSSAGQCVGCIDESERVMCPNVQERQCFYPDRCKADRCYFSKRDAETIQEESEHAKRTPYTRRLREDWDPASSDVRDDRGNSLLS